MGVQETQHCIWKYVAVILRESNSPGQWGIFKKTTIYIIVKLQDTTKQLETLGK
jgi:hypothetical protein